MFGNMSLFETLMVFAALTGVLVTTIVAMIIIKINTWLNKPKVSKEAKKKDIPAGKYKEYCEEYIGDVLVIIKEYEDIEVVTYDNTVYESIDALLRSEESLSNYEVEELKKLNRTLKQLRGEKAPKKEKKEGAGEIQCDVVPSDLYGDIVILNAPQVVELGNKGRMKAWIDFHQGKEGELPFMFIKTIHIVNEGKKKGKFAAYNSRSVTPYYLRDDEGKENKEQKDLFFARFLQNDSEDWEEERNDYNELQDILRHYNAHRHLLKWDDKAGQWLILPTAPKQQEEVKEEAAPKPKEELEVEAKEESKTEAVSVEELSDEEVVINMLQQLSKDQLSILIDIIKSGLQEANQKKEETTMEAAFKKALNKKGAE